MSEYYFESAIFVLLVGFSIVINILLKARKKTLQEDVGRFWFANLVIFVGFFGVLSLCYFMLTWASNGLDSGGPENHYALATLGKLLSVDGLTYADPSDLGYDPWWANIAVILWCATTLIMFFLPSAALKKITSYAWSRALLGTLSCHTYRRRWWLGKVFIPPILLGLLLPLPLLWDSYASFPFFIHDAGAIILIILLMLTFSQPARDKENMSATVETNKPDAYDRHAGHRPWEEKLRQGGVELDYLCEISVAEDTENVLDAGLNFTVRAAPFVRNGGAVALLEGVRDILLPGQDTGKRHKHIRAQDDCGQLESVAIAAEALFLRHYTVTLLIVPDEQIRQVRQHLGDFFSGEEDSERIYTLTASTSYPEEDTSMILLVDVKTLSDRFMGELKSTPHILKRIGLVVWWDLHQYTGIRAGNFRAISHRLHRFLKTGGRSDVRVMTFLRQAQGDEAELGRFANALLPFEFYPESIINIPVKPACRLVLYQINGVRPNSQPTALNALPKHALLYAAYASIQGGWMTGISSGGVCLTETEMRGLFQHKEIIDGQEESVLFQERIALSPARSEARLLWLDSSNALSLSAMIVSSGRATRDEACHIGIMTNGNPYINFILAQFCKEGKQMPAAQIMIAPKPNRDIVSRHIRMALFETKNTGRGIEEDFQFENEYIQGVLQGLKNDNQLTIREVRYLSRNDGELTVEPEYDSQEGGRGQTAQPLDLDNTGTDLVGVIATDEGAVNRGLVLAVDSERVTILTYPGRIFYRNGRRYKIPLNSRQWQRGWRQGRIECQETNEKYQTLRIRKPRIEECHRLEEGSVSRNSNSGKEGIYGFYIRLTYSETIFGCAFKPSPYDENSTLPPGDETFPSLNSSRFVTEAFCLDIPNANWEAITSTAEALYYALSIHLGVDENSLEIIPVRNQKVNDKPFNGIMVVELYASGIGLVRKMDVKLLCEVFRMVKKWLKQCHCHDGCEKCLKADEKRFKNALPLSKREALKTLERLID